MKALMTNKGATCKHPRMICEECGSFAYVEKPGPKGISKKFLARARKLQKIMREEAEREAIA